MSYSWFDWKPKECFIVIYAMKNASSSYLWKPKEYFIVIYASFPTRCTGSCGGCFDRGVMCLNASAQFLTVCQCVWVYLLYWIYVHAVCACVCAYVFACVCVYQRSSLTEDRKLRTIRNCLIVWIVVNLWYRQVEEGGILVVLRFEYLQHYAAAQWLDASNSSG